MRALPGVLATLMCAAVMVGCGGGDTPREPARAATPIDPATTGRIAATVRFPGTPPASRPAQMFGECAALYPDGPPSSNDVLVKDGKVQNAFVWITAGLGDRTFAVPTTPVEIDQVKCLYVPRVAGAQVGQKVLFKSSDTMFHNVHGTPEDSSSWNIGLPTVGSSREIVVDHPEVPISLRCDVHPWMQGWLGVVDHPYFGVSDADGRVVLAGVPAGEYVVGVWHERLGKAEGKATVTPQGESSLELTLPGT